MRRLTRLTTIPLVSALLCFGAVRVPTSNAVGSPYTAPFSHLHIPASTAAKDYLIEAYEVYCKGGATSCGLSQVAFAEVEALSPFSLWPNETPRDTYAECDLAAYIDPVTHDPVEAEEYAYAGQDTALGYHPGTIGGWGQVQFNATEATINAQSKLLLWTHDSVTGTSAAIRGTQYTNNVTDTLSQPGGFTISMYGPTVLYDFVTGRVVGTGAPTSMTCSTSSPTTYLSFYEGVIAGTDADAG